MRWGVRRDSKQASYRRRARLAAATDEYRKSYQRRIDRLSKTPKDQRSEKQNRALKSARKEKEFLDKKFKKYTKGLSKYDIKKGKQSLAIRRLSSHAFGGMLVSALYEGSIAGEIYG